jgi:hypothetical protein
MIRPILPRREASQPSVDGERNDNHPNKADAHAVHHCELIPADTRIVNVHEPSLPGSDGKIMEKGR